MRGIVHVTVMVVAGFVATTAHAKGGLEILRTVELKYGPVVDSVGAVPAVLRTVPAIPGNGGSLVTIGRSDVEVDNGASLFVSGLALRFGDNNQFLVGLRPEIILAPRTYKPGTISASIFGSSANNVQIGLSYDQPIRIFWGAELKNWLIPEFMAEYRSNDQTALGLAYKRYKLRTRSGWHFDQSLETFSTTDIADLPVIEAYGRFGGWTLAWAFITVKKKNIGNLIDIEKGSGWRLGYAVSF